MLSLCLFVTFSFNNIVVSWYCNNILSRYALIIEKFIFQPLNMILIMMSSACDFSVNVIREFWLLVAKSYLATTQHDLIILSSVPEFSINVIPSISAINSRILSSNHSTWFNNAFKCPWLFFHVRILSSNHSIHQFHFLINLDSFFHWCTNTTMDPSKFPFDMDPSELLFDIEAYKMQSEIEERYILN